MGFLKKKYYQYAFVCCMVSMLTCLISFASVIHANGHIEVALWLKGWLFAYLIALPAAWLLIPFIKKFLDLFHWE